MEYTRTGQTLAQGQHLKDDFVQGLYHSIISQNVMSKIVKTWNLVKDQ